MTRARRASAPPERPPAPRLPAVAPPPPTDPSSTPPTCHHAQPTRPGNSLPCRRPPPSENGLPHEAGADDRTRTGDLVLTKDALYLLSYIGTPVACPPPDPAAAVGRLLRPEGRPRAARIRTGARPGATAGAPPRARAAAREELERETGIEPATNSLEGCDSTTELLPPSRSPAVVEHGPARPCPPACRAKLVARGGFEPPKPLGRQIYSLLRLTAPQPRRIPRPSAKTAATHAPGRPARQADTDTAVTSPTGDRTDAETHLSRGSNPLELAKGFEPPTR